MLDREALSDRQLELLKAVAQECEFDDWKAVTPLALIAKVMAVIPAAARLAVEHPDWGRTHCLDEAEACVRELPARGKSVSSALARWMRG